MKLSQMTNEQACNAMIRLADPVSRLLEDKSILPLLQQFSEMKDVPAAEAVGAILPKAVAFAMKDHRGDLYEIIGAMTDATAGQVAEMNFMQTIAVVMDFVDKDFVDFFKSSGNVTSNPGKS